MKRILLGDSLSEGFNNVKKLNIINEGISGDKTTDCIGRILDIIKQKPDELFVMIGTNDILLNAGVWATPLRIPLFDSYKLLFTLIRDSLEKTRVVIISVPPMRYESNVVDSKTLNDRVKQVNNFLEEQCNVFDFIYMDLHSKLLDTTNQLNHQCTIDGIHFTKEAYRIWYETLHDYIQQQ